MSDPPLSALRMFSHFSLLEGVSAPQALVARGADLGYRVLGLTDRDSLAGVPPFLRACREAGIQAVVGAELTLADGSRLPVFAMDQEGYRSLCRILSEAHLHHPRLSPRTRLQDLAPAAAHLLVLTGGRRGPLIPLLLRRRWADALSLVRRWQDTWGHHLFLELQGNDLPGDRWINGLLLELGERTGLRSIPGGGGALRGAGGSAHPRPCQLHSRARHGGPAPSGTPAQRAGIPPPRTGVAETLARLPCRPCRAAGFSPAPFSPDIAGGVPFPALSPSSGSVGRPLPVAQDPGGGRAPATGTFLRRWRPA